MAKLAAESTTTGSDNAKLDARHWTKAALSVLAEQGIDYVKVEPLAKRLGVTKGSFYWHFKDRDALLDAILSEWRQKATIGIIERLNQSGVKPAQRLRQLLQLPLTGESSTWGADVELSIRLWGKWDGRARKALEEVDQLRLLYISGLLAESGIPPEEAQARAVIAYSYLRVAATLIPSSAAALRRRCEDIIMAAH